MKTKELAAIGTKLSGIACLVVAVWKLNYLVLAILQHFAAPRSELEAQMLGMGWWVVAIVLSFAMTLAAGLVLLVRGDQIGRYISRDESEVFASIDSATFLGVGVAIVGIWIVAVSVPVFLERLGALLVYVSSVGSEDTSGFIKTKFMPEVIGALLKTSLGFWMFFGSKGIVGMRDRLREAGLRKDTQQPSPGDSSTRAARASEPPEK